MVHPIPMTTLCCLAAAALLGAQGQVVPAVLTATPAGSHTVYPFGVDTPMRVQTLYHASETGLVATMPIASLQLRGDELRFQAGKAGVQLQIEMSTTTATGATLDPTFAVNRGANHTVVFARRAVALPAITFSFPGPFLAPFLLDAPFAYDPGAGNLLIEYDVASQPAGVMHLDTPAEFALGAHRTFGASCGGLYAPTAGGGLGHRIAVNLYGGAASAPAVHLLGSAELGTPVPIPGSPGCSLFVTPDWLTPTQIDNNGIGQVSIPVPADRSLRGASVWSQFLTVTQRIESSNGSQVVLGDRHQVHRVYSLATNTAAQGFVQPHVAPVIRLQ